MPDNRADEFGWAVGSENIEAWSIDDKISTGGPFMERLDKTLYVEPVSAEESDVAKQLRESDSHRMDHLLVFRLD